MKKRVCEICGKIKKNVVKKHETKKLVCGQCDRKADQIIALCSKCGKSKIIADYLLKNQNAQIKDVAAAFSRSIDTIRKYVKKYEIPYAPPRWHNKKIDDLALLNYIRENPNVFIADIAKHFNVHPQTIFRYLRKYNVRADRKKRRNAELAKYIQENPDKSQKEIGRYFNLSKETIRRRIEKAGISYQKKSFAGCYEKNRH